MARTIKGDTRKPKSQMFVFGPKGFQTSTGTPIRRRKKFKPSFAPIILPSGKRNFTAEIRRALGRFRVGARGRR